MVIKLFVEREICTGSQCDVLYIIFIHHAGRRQTENYTTYNIKQKND